MFDKKKRFTTDLEVDDGTLLLTSSLHQEGDEQIWMDQSLIDQTIVIARFDPTSFGALVEVVDQLQTIGKVVVCLDRLNKINKVKGLNFLSGAIYALNGFMTKIKANVYELEIPLETK